MDQNGKLTIFIDSGQNSARVVGEEALVVEVSGQQLRAQIHRHLGAIVETVLMETRLESAIIIIL